MSYARWGWDGSDVYVYGSARSLVCCACTMLDERGEDFEAATYSAMLGHLEQHQAKGQHVPQYAFDRLRAERDRVPCDDYDPDAPDP